MTRADAVTKIADALNIERTDAHDLVDEYAQNAGDSVQCPACEGVGVAGQECPQCGHMKNGMEVLEVAELSEARVSEIISDRKEFEAERHAGSCVGPEHGDDTRWSVL